MLCTFKQFWNLWESQQILVSLKLSMRKQYLLAKLTLICMNFLAGYFLMRHNILGIRKPGWNLCWGYAEDLHYEVSNLWRGGVALKHFFCLLSGEFVAADIWIWLYKELGPFEFNCAEHWAPHSSQHDCRFRETIYNSWGLFSFRVVFSSLCSSLLRSIFDNRTKKHKRDPWLKKIWKQIFAVWNLNALSIMPPL